MKGGKSETKLDKFDSFVSLTKQRSIQILIAIAGLYILLVSFELPFVFNTNFASSSIDMFLPISDLTDDLEQTTEPVRPLRWIARNSGPPKILSDLRLDSSVFEHTEDDGSIELFRAAKKAWEVGRKRWREIELGKAKGMDEEKPKNDSTECPLMVMVTRSEFLKRNSIMEIPCGLTLGSHITVVGMPKRAHAENDPRVMGRDREPPMVSQFILELQGLKVVEGEDPPRVFHFNPRLRGDWSGKPVIEQNTCYRMQWGKPMRCEGWRSKAHEETVDSLVKCEKWIRDDPDHAEESRTTWWLNRLMGRAKVSNVGWPFPFAEERLFVLTVIAGLEGYHVSVDGKHVSSFPYRTGFTLEDATGIIVKGDVDVQSVFAASLPTTHPTFAPQKHLEMSNVWKAPPLPEEPPVLFIGILSAGNHFAERMAARKSWMQHNSIKTSFVVARFFVALHARQDVNVELKKEAEFFGDIVIVPYMDNYDLVVLKTVAICEYGVHELRAKFVMKGDDDTFVRVDALTSEIKRFPAGKSVYIGNINYHHKPMRQGKWAVAYEEWPEEYYPHYANGPGYILSSDIASFIVKKFETHKLRLFKMEDVSVGIWVKRFNSSKSVLYIHSLRFCQFGCIEGYYTAHYQSPRQMLCLWNHLQEHGKPTCCNMR